MYIFKQNIKNICFALIGIGILAITYGFYSASQNYYTDEEIKYEVKKLYKKTSNENSEEESYSSDEHHGSHYSTSYKFSTLFHAIEKKLHCHFTEDEIKRAKTLDDVIYITKHYFHAQKQRPWSSLLVSNLFFLMISLAGLVWLAVQYISQSGWSASLLRIPQAVSSFLPYGGAIMLFIIITGALHWHHTYHWMDQALTYEYVYEDSISSEHPHYTNDKEEGVVPNPKYDYIIAGKTAYLNIPFFIIRAIIYLLGWCIVALLLRKFSLKEDEEGGLKWHNKMFTLSAIFIVFAAVTTSTGAWDWIMSIDTHWFSTLFGWYSFASFFVSACAVMAIITVHLKYSGYLEMVNENHMHDFGRYLLAFSIFWTYLWFAQYMLIWYSNIPEEVTYYLIRFESYHILIIIALVLNFLNPMLLIQDRAAKRLKGQVLFVAILILIGHFIDVFVMIMPGTVGTHWHLGFVEIGTFLGYLGFFFFIVLNSLSKRPLVQKNHPMMIESKHHHI